MTAAAGPAFSSLLRLVTDGGVHPLDAAHVAAILELNGYNDRHAVGLGYEDVFDLAEALYHATASGPRREKTLTNETRPPWIARMWLVIRLYVRGLSFAAPMLLSSGSVLAIRYSLWSYLGFDVEIATAIALGTFASFLVAGGFTQAIARRGLFYISQDQWTLARWSVLRLLLAGIVAMGLFGLAVYGFVLLFPILPWRVVAISGAYFAPMTLIWLGICLLYMLHREPYVLLLVAFGIGLVWLLHDVLLLPMMASHIIAMILVATAAFGLSVLLLFGLDRTKARERPPKTMRWSQVSHSLAPFFLYGIAYFALTFVDRLMAWSVPSEFHPQFFWFLGDYELGLDWALWTLVLPMGIVEIYIDGLYRRIYGRSKGITVDDLPAFNRRFQRDHLQTAALALVAGLVSIFLIVQVMHWLVDGQLLPDHPLADSRTYFVFLIAAPAFSVITVGLQSVLVLFSLNEPWAATKACGQALVFNLLVGFLASRYIGYWWAVLGLAVGAVLFAVLTTREALRVLKRLDYFLMRGT